MCSLNSRTKMLWRINRAYHYSQMAHTGVSGRRVWEGTLEKAGWAAEGNRKAKQKRHHTKLLQGPGGSILDRRGMGQLLKNKQQCGSESKDRGEIVTGHRQPLKSTIFNEMFLIYWSPKTTQISFFLHRHKLILWILFFINTVKWSHNAVLTIAVTGIVVMVQWDDTDVKRVPCCCFYYLSTSAVTTDEGYLSLNL